MSLPVFVVNAFSKHSFGGNPAAVVPLERWLPDALLQSIAAQHNLSETAFFVAEAEHWTLRWFTPVREVDLCGHATLATAFVLRQAYGIDEMMRFQTRSGQLCVDINASGQLELDLPATQLEAVVPDPAVVAALGVEVHHAYRPIRHPWQWVYRVEDQRTLQSVKPDFHALAAAADYGVIVTAPGEAHDFVSRFFAPTFGIDEDPVTGSAHCLLTPLWAAELNQIKMQARQCSQRGGELTCTLAGDRVRVAGDSVLYSRGAVLAALQD